MIFYTIYWGIVGIARKDRSIMIIKINYIIWKRLGKRKREDEMFAIKDRCFEQFDGLFWSHTFPCSIHIHTPDTHTPITLALPFIIWVKTKETEDKNSRLISAHLERTTFTM